MAAKHVVEEQGWAKPYMRREAHHFIARAHLLSQTAGSRHSVAATDLSSAAAVSRLASQGHAKNSRGPVGASGNALSDVTTGHGLPCPERRSRL